MQEIKNTSSNTWLCVKSTNNCLNEHFQYQLYTACRSLSYVVWKIYKKKLTLFNEIFTVVYLAQTSNTQSRKLIDFLFPATAKTFYQTSQ